MLGGNLRSVLKEYRSMVEEMGGVSAIPPSTFHRTITLESQCSGVFKGLTKSMFEVGGMWRDWVLGLHVIVRDAGKREPARTKPAARSESTSC